MKRRPAQPEVFTLPDAVAPGQTFIHDGRTFVVNPYEHAELNVPVWFEVDVRRRLAFPVA